MSDSNYWIFSSFCSRSWIIFGCGTTESMYSLSSSMGTKFLKTILFSILSIIMCARLLQIPGITTHLAVKGSYMVEYSILICVRHGSIYLLKRETSEARCLTNFSSLPVDLALDGNRFVTIHMDSTFQGYTLKVCPYWLWNICQKLCMMVPG